MTNIDFRIRQSLIGCTGAQLARWLGVTPVTVTRYRTGVLPIPGPVELAMKALGEGWRP